MADPVRDFKMTSEGEWEITNGDFAKVSGAQAVPQAADIRLSIVLGEIYLDPGRGVDYKTIMAKGTDPLLVQSILREPLLQIPDVTEVVGSDLEEDSATREASISFQLETIYGESITGALTPRGQ